MFLEYEEKIVNLNNVSDIGFDSEKFSISFYSGQELILSFRFKNEPDFDNAVSELKKNIKPIKLL